ncbi:hypothetical protein [Candidatus Pelagadaptatus aseana]|uniref:hypothetical protein n=1 Tax=Candidatus Pelagadaptatus aseana TaxID=3120508 RepID=UPI003C6F245F
MPKNKSSDSSQKSAANNVLPFKRPSAAQKHKGKSLCRSGFHKWKIVQKKQFDVKQGRLVTIYKCSRCGEQKVELH